jgi:hypothetical protein
MVKNCLNSSFNSFGGISILYISLYLNRLINIILFVTIAEAKIIITADQGVRGGKLIELKKTVVTAVEKCPTVKTILVAKRTGNPVVSSPLDVDLDEVGLK